jgi:hypothetical protein
VIRYGSVEKIAHKFTPHEVSLVVSARDDATAQAHVWHLLERWKWNCKGLLSGVVWVFFVILLPITEQWF